MTVNIGILRVTIENNIADTWFAEFDASRRRKDDKWATAATLDDAFAHEPGPRAGLVVSKIRMPTRYILTLSCTDQPGIDSAVAMSSAGRWPAPCAITSSAACS